MKKFSEYVLEQSNQSEIATLYHQWVKEKPDIVASIEKLLGSDYVVKYTVSSLGGVDRASFFIVFYDKNPPHNISRNSVVHTHFNSDFKNGKFSWELLNNHYSQKNAGIKFRKITGKTYAEASKKLLDWISKNKINYDKHLKNSQ